MKKIKISIITAAAVLAVSAAVGFSSLNHTYTISDEYSTFINLFLSSDGVIESPGIKFEFYDIKKYFTPEDPEAENAYEACAYELWSDSVELPISSYYRYEKCYEAAGTDIRFEVTDQTDSSAVLHYYGTGVVITSFEKETVDDYWYIGIKPFWKGEAPDLYRMEKPMSPDESAGKWEAEHPDVMERLKSGNTEDYCTE